MDPLPIVDALTDFVARLPEAVLQIDVHDEIFDPDNYWYAPEIGWGWWPMQRWLSEFERRGLMSRAIDGGLDPLTGRDC